jgi:two-component system, NtrC family, response regulator HydG
MVVEKALKEANYNKSEAAKLLNIDRKTLYNKLSRFGIEL